MMSAIVLLHRWLGVASCLLFAMWFASGIVMHFVPFPSLTEAERFAGLAPVDRAEVRITVAEAVTASKLPDATRARLIQRGDGPVYIVSGRSQLGAVHASDGRDASVTSADIALAIARAHAVRRGLDPAPAAILARADYDQWSVPNGFDRHRPLFRMVVSGALGSKLDPTTDNGISAKMGLDATAPVSAPELAFKRIRVKGEEDVDLATALQADPSAAIARLLAEALV